MKHERRVMTAGTIEVRALEDAIPRIEGHAAVFNRDSEPIGGMFVERVAPGAFTRAIDEAQDVRALWNHDPNHILARTKSGTLLLEEDEIGLRMSFTPPDTQLGRDLVESISRGDVDQMSFGFYVRGEEWEERAGQLPLRTLIDVDLFDVSPVTFPAYNDTDVAVRSLSAWQERRGQRPRLCIARAMVNHEAATNVPAN